MSSATEIAALPTVKVALTIEVPNQPPEIFDLVFNSKQPRLQIGRERQNDVWLTQPSVSRFHAAVALKPDGKLFIADLESRNGTFLNGQRLLSGEAYEIADNDLIRFGDVTARFNWTGAPAAPQMSATEENALVAEYEINESDALPAAAVQTGSVAHDGGAETKPKQQSIAKSAGIVSIAVMGSRVLGLAREAVFASVLGASNLFDAYLVAFRIPNLLRDLFAEGALSVAFVKTFTDYQINKSEKEAWRLASLIFNALVVVLSLISLLGILFAPVFVPLLAPGFANTPGKTELTVTMTQIMFPFILLVAMAAVAMGVLNTKGVFGIPASASTIFNIVSVLTGLGFAYWLSGGKMSGDWTVIGLSIGTMFGGAAQFLMQVPSLFAVGFRFAPVLSFRDAGVRQVFRLMTPAILGTSAVQINVLVNTSLVSDINGAQGWLNCAFRLMQLPIGIFGVAVATAAIPALSKFAAQQDTNRFRETLGGSIRLVFLLTLPSACGLIVLGEPIIRLLYERGKFDADATTMTAYTLAAYAVGLTGYAAIKIVSPAFYALNDARTPMLVSLFSILINAIGGYGFKMILSGVGVSNAHPQGLAHAGVALATSLIALVNFFALVFFLRRKIKRIEGGKTILAFLKIAVASLSLSAVCWFSYYFLHQLFAAHNLIFKIIETFVPIGLGGLTFLLVAKLLGVAELNQAFDGFARRFARK
jgi:putative peptidoglycan lipid II flippase